MANILTTPGVLVLDTPAVVSATNQYKIRKVRLVPAAQNSTAMLKDGSGRVIAGLAAVANGVPDEMDFSSMSAPFKGLELATLVGTGAPAKYVPSPGQLGTGVIPVTPPLSSADARKQLRGF
jgi:hypothetical protein